LGGVSRLVGWLHWGASAPPSAPAVSSRPVPHSEARASHTIEVESLPKPQAKQPQSSEGSIDGTVPHPQASHSSVEISSIATEPVEPPSAPPIVTSNRAPPEPQESEAAWSMLDGIRRGSVVAAFAGVGGIMLSFAGVVCIVLRRNKLG